MSKKSIHDCIKEYEKTAFTVSRSEAMQFAWNFCDSQCKSEIEELKAKFSEATKTYTDDIDRLEKENDDLEKTVSSQTEIIYKLENECSFDYKCPVNSNLQKQNDELKKKLKEVVLIMGDLEKEKAFACESFICDSCPITCYDMKTKRLKMFISINKDLLKGVEGD